MSGIVINTNMMSLNAQRNLRKTQAPLQTAMERLASGLRINSAKDDAAGLAIATRMTSQIRGLTVAARNAADGLSIVQTAEGALDEVVNNLQRIRELALQAMSGQYSASDISYMQFEVNALVEEVNRISEQSKFNNVTLFNGYYNVRIVSSYQASESPISVNISNVNIYDSKGTSNKAGYVQSTSTNQTILAGTTWGINDWTTTLTNNIATERGILGDVSTDIAIDRSGTVTYGKYSLLRLNPDYDATNPSGASYYTSNASNTTAIIDGSLNAVIKQKSYLGAKANQFDAAIRNIDNVIEATTASRSRIMDADFAKETAEMTKSLILQQAGISVLAQANSIPQNVLSLLR